MNRREFVCAGVATAISGTGGFWSAEALGQDSLPAYKAAYKALDRFVEQYLRAMNAPGLTLVLADREGVQRLVTYGFTDPASRGRVKPDELFQIGSISKSFVAVCLLEAREEGKLDLNQPIAAYLPWFRMETSFEPVTPHHLLTHTSGLPGIPPVFLSDPSAKHRAVYAPGKLFHYNNMGYAVLGQLLMSLDQATLPAIYRKRVFERLGMTASEPVITLDQRERTAK